MSAHVGDVPHLSLQSKYNIPQLEGHAGRPDLLYSKGWCSNAAFQQLSDVS